MSFFFARCRIHHNCTQKINIIIKINMFLNDLEV
jgi:hypothetical protein